MNFDQDVDYMFRLNKEFAPQKWGFSHPMKDLETF
jgi:hypothetical protein